MYVQTKYPIICRQRTYNINNIYHIHTTRKRLNITQIDKVIIIFFSLYDKT